MSGARQDGERPLRDRRTRLARRLWPKPLKREQGERLAWGMNATAAPLLRDLSERKGWRRWLGR